MRTTGINRRANVIAPVITLSLLSMVVPGTGRYGETPTIPPPFSHSDQSTIPGPRYVISVFFFFFFEKKQRRGWYGTHHQMCEWWGDGGIMPILPGGRSDHTRYGTRRVPSHYLHGIYFTSDSFGRTVFTRANTGPNNMMESEYESQYRKGYRT
jgi:hypothetical protein